MNINVRFRPEYLDFQRGIRVGNLEDSERIKRILKLELEDRYQQPFVTERWGRGVFWQWIGFLPKANRTAKPVSSQVSFGCAKYFIMVDTGTPEFRCGMQVERGYLKAPPESRSCELRDDWDWHRLVQALHTKRPASGEISRLLGEGFRIHAGSWEAPAVFSHETWPGVAHLRRALEASPRNRWAGFQIYFPMSEQEVKVSTGIDLVESMVAVFSEVTPLMNSCMQIGLQPAG